MMLFLHRSLSAVSSFMTFTLSGCIRPYEKVREWLSMSSRYLFHIINTSFKVLFSMKGFLSYEKVLLSCYIIIIITCILFMQWFPFLIAVIICHLVTSLYAKDIQLDIRNACEQDLLICVTQYFGFILYDEYIQHTLIKIKASNETFVNPALVE